jgi:hypothetical protein
MVEIEVAIKSVEGMKLAENVSSETDVVFNAVASISQNERSPGFVTLKFNIDLESRPEIAKITVAGTAMIKGEDIAIDALLEVKGDDSVPPVFMKIYEKVYAIFYLLSGSLKIPYPTPGLLRSVQVVSGREVAQHLKNEAASSGIQK